MYYNHEIDHVKGTTFERFAGLMVKVMNDNSG